MDWSDSPEPAHFRAQVREVIEQHLPERYRCGEGCTVEAGVVE